MKTGIVTFHDANNYGAVLQAYALQETLKTLGANPVFVDFGRAPSKPPPAQAIPPELQARLEKYPRLASRRNNMTQYYEKRVKIFTDFREHYLNVSRPYGASDWHTLGDAYDTFIVGSDQVWNYEIIGREEQYFLPFAPDEKKMAYAASFGVSALPEILHGYYTERLRLFRAISVREKSGQTLVKNLVGRDVPVCLDPVFLPEKGVWERFAGQGRETGSQIVLYLIDMDTELISLAEKLGKARGLPIKLITASLQARLGAEHWSNTDVVNFVSQLAQAEEVLTDSFHGLAFSLIFRKNFHIGFRVTQTPRYGRLHTLLNLTGLQSRVGVGEEKPAIDWPQVEKRLEKHHAASLSFLRENCL